MNTATHTIEMPELNKSDLGNQATIRANAMRGEDIMKIPLDKIVIRQGFNVRVEMGDLEGLAQSILENGQSSPGRVDVLENGTFVLTDGHRRFKAMLILKEQGHEPFFKAIVNISKTTEEQRILQMFTTQDNKPLLPNEVAELIQRLVNLGYNPASVAKKIGKTAAYVSQMLEYATESPAIKQHVNNGHLAVSAVIKIKKAIPNQTERTEKITKAIENKKPDQKKITTSDVTGEIVNSFKELKKFLEIMDGTDLAGCKTETHNFVCAIINNEMSFDEIKEYFSTGR